MYEQLDLSQYMQMQMKDKRVKDLTSWINSQGKAQYTQIAEVIRDTYEQEKDSPYLLDRLTNAVSVWVLRQSSGYMAYLKNEVVD